MGGLEVLRQVEAKYPALLFKQQLTAYVEKIYGMIRDNLKKEISPLLSLCIQVSGIVHTSFLNLFSFAANIQKCDRRFVFFLLLRRFVMVMAGLLTAGAKDI